MAVYEVWLKSDLKKPLTVTALQGVFFTGDNDAYKIGVQVTDNGSAASLSGTVTGYIVRADGGTLSVSGTLSGSTAYILLPAAALNMEGPIDITVKLTTNSVVTTLGACRGYVQRATTDTLIDSGTVITVVGSVNGVHPDANGNVTLSAGDITTGTLPTSQVPNISAAKITSGTVGAARLPDMVGATASNNGTKGAVPAPSAGDQGKFLTGAGTWVAGVMKSGDTMTGDLTSTNIIAQASSGNPSFYINNNSGGAIARIVQRGTTGLRFRVYKTPGNVNVYEDFQLPYATTDSTESYPIITAKGGETIRDQLLMASTSGISDSNDYKRLYFCDEDGNQLAQQIFRASTRVMYFQIKDADGSNYLNYTLPAVDSIVSENTSYRILTMKPGGGFVYGNGDTYSTNASYVAPLVGYVGAEGKVIYFTVPVTGDMSSITSISATRLAGAIRTCESKFIADKSSSSYDWTSHNGLTITVQKVASNLARILMTFTSAPTNATENAVVCGAFMVTLSFSVS